MGTSGDKIVLLDGMGSGSGSATNGLLSMIPGMFANLIGGNKMDPNLVVYRHSWISLFQGAG